MDLVISLCNWFYLHINSFIETCLQSSLYFWLRLKYGIQLVLRFADIQFEKNSLLEPTDHTMFFMPHLTAFSAVFKRIDSSFLKYTAPLA